MGLRLVPVTLLAGIATAVGTVAVYQWWWGLLLAAAATLAVAAATPPGWSTRLPLALGFDAVVALTAVPRSEGDYLVAGTVWATVSKPADHRLLGIDGLAAIVRAAAVPVLAIGGVTLDRLPELTARGAAGFAAIGMFIREGTSADKPEECRAMPLHDLARRVTP